MLACGTGKGCSETTNLYGFHNPAVISNIRNLETNVKEKSGPFVVNVAGPLIGLAAGRSAVFKVSKDLNFKYSRSNFVFQFERSF